MLVLVANVLSHGRGDGRKKDERQSEARLGELPASTPILNHNLPIHRADGFLPAAILPGDVFSTSSFFADDRGVNA